MNSKDKGKKEANLATISSSHIRPRRLATTIATFRWVEPIDVLFIISSLYTHACLVVYHNEKKMVAIVMLPLADEAVNSSESDDVGGDSLSLVFWK
ncbi:hypothetical protein E3N88_12727 [Mikania micrantha]|uniref:Uncharacterized protein n=1 Tax=Mikania micrantha TaxID=192012 RepID=A0A5N6P7N1_9ASTR|nr:hypothetical protein E3N88_12727 [Mikania micrantha]